VSKSDSSSWLSVKERLLVEDGTIVEVIVEGFLVGDGVEARSGEVAKLHGEERHLVLQPDELEHGDGDVVVDEDILWVLHVQS
jgi:hypothetical protein